MTTSTSTTELVGQLSRRIFRVLPFENIHLRFTMDFARPSAFTNLILLFLFPGLGSALTELQNEFAIQFLRHLMRSTCVLLSDDGNDVRSFARRFISTVRIAPSHAPEYLIKEKYFVGERLSLVLTEADFDAYHKIFNKMPEPSDVSRFTWIVILESTFNLSAIDGRLYIPYDCQFFVVQPGGGGLEILEVYTGKKRNVYVHVFGTWSIETGLLAVNSLSWRMNLEGYPMDVLMFENECKTRIECSLREIWFDLAHFMNITTRLTVSHGDIVDAVFDVILEPITFDSYTISTRAIAPIWKVSTYMHIKHSANEGFSWFKYFSAFQDDFLTTFPVWIIVIGTCVTFFDYFHSRTLNRVGFQPLKGIFTVLFLMCNQGGIELERSLAILCLILIFRIAILIVQNLSIGTLVSFLTLRIPQLPFYDLEGFVRDGTYRLGEYSAFPHEQKASKMFVPMSEMPRTLSEGTKMLCSDDKFAFLADNNEVMMLEKKKCEIVRIPRPAITIFWGILLDNQSPFEFVLNSAFTHLSEHGIIGKMRREVYGEVQEENESDFHPISTGQIEPFLTVVQVGAVSALVVLAGEKVCHALVTQLRKRRLRSRMGEGNLLPMSLVHQRDVKRRRRFALLL